MGISPSSFTKLTTRDRVNIMMANVTTVEPTLVIVCCSTRPGSTKIFFLVAAALNTLSTKLDEVWQSVDRAEHCVLSCIVKKGSSQNGSLLMKLCRYIFSAMRL